MAYIVNEDGSTSMMQQVRCRDEDRDLQTLLEKNHALLAGDQISPDDPRRWLLVKREMPVPDPNSGEDRWSIDFFFVDQGGMPTFVECKRYYDTRSRREIVGQMLEYAANGAFYWSKEDIRQYAEATAQERNQTLEAAVVQLTNDESLTVDMFLETIVTNLSQGQVRLVFFLEEAPYELRSIVDFLNKQMERAEVLIVEAKLFVNGGTKVVIPFLFGYTEQARQIKRTVTISRNSSGRRKWDEVTFFEDAELTQGLSADYLAALRKLYNFTVSKADTVSWGTGTSRGSFNAKFSRISVRSLFSVYSDGYLVLNFGWLDDNENERKYRDNLRAAVGRIEGLVISTDTQYPGFSIEQWAPHLGALLEAMSSVIDS
jgi:hypothetical protein